MDCLTSRILKQKYPSYKCQFCSKVCPSYLYKIKLPDVSDSIRQLQIQVTRIQKFEQKQYRKTSEDECYAIKQF